MKTELQGLRLRRRGDTARFVKGCGFLRHSFDIDMLDLADETILSKRDNLPTAKVQVVSLVFEQIPEADRCDRRK